jgi:hypothetical protein
LCARRNNGQKKKKKIIKILGIIARDMKKDATDFDGKPFTGLTVGAHYGYACAAIAALANIIKLIVEEDKNE